MQKVFLLLRSNKQSGPFSLEELVKSGLKENDLVWVEGKSACWSHPAEIGVLKQYVEIKPKETASVKSAESTKPSVSQPDQEAYKAPVNNDHKAQVEAASKRIFVSLPKNNNKPVTEVPAAKVEPAKEESTPVTSIEDKAEEIRKRVMARAAGNGNGEQLPGTPAPAPSINIEEKAEELRKRAMAFSEKKPEVARGPVTISPEQSAKVIEEKAGKLRIRVMAYSENSVAERQAPVIIKQEQPAPVSGMEEKAEELKKRVPAFSEKKADEAQAPVQEQPASMISFEEKAEELRKRIMSQAAEKKTAPQTPVTNQEQSAPVINIEDKAEEIKKRVLAHVAGKETAPQVTAREQPAPVTNIEEKAEELRKRVLAFSEAKAQASATTTQEQPVPVTNIEEKAELIRKRIQEFNAGTADGSTKGNESRNNAPVKETRRPPVFPDRKSPDENPLKKSALSSKTVDEIGTSRLYKKKSGSKESLPGKMLLVAFMSIFFFAGLYWVVKYTSDESDATVIENSENLISRSEEVKPASESASAETGQTLDVNQITTNRYDIPETKADSKSDPKTVVKENAPAANQKSAEKKPAPAVTNTAPVNTVKEQENNAGKENSEPVADASQKKKTLTDKIDGFFNKFKKKKPEDGSAEQTVNGEAKEAKNDDRTAKRRDEEAASNVSKEYLADHVDVSSNAPAENWMLGVQGLKLTIKNRSGENVKSGAVEVRYFNAQNEVIERKTIVFSNVPAKKSVTIAAPDHRLADHTDHHLVSVE